MRTLSDFDYFLPEHLIAQEPALRGTSRLLHVNASSTVADWHVNDLTSLLQPGDLIVINNTRVLRARLSVQRMTGGLGEVLIDRILDPHTARGQLKMSRRPRPNESLVLSRTSIPLTILDIEDRWVTLHSEIPFLSLLESYGSIPLPPYMKRSSNAADDQNYQTIFANSPGAVAAPTAGLHFTDALLKELEARNIKCASVTLHVGAGTFLPVKTELLEDHVMHEEWFDIPNETVETIEKTKQMGGRIIAIGTTTLRALESAAIDGRLKSGSAETRLFIRPGFRFQVVDQLFTNFHLPRSTLLILVSAFAGIDTIQKAYQHAIEEGYRFFSYGDAMLIERAQEGST